ncbi:hypothetical protein AB0B66_08465 [Catellatospora sp. NPDC049111]|uniref:hypothetical protein n=1 Tax=Catellatospora sp. NPDC049111 TaxID=3155271 RepID=UPI0033D7B354
MAADTGNALTILLLGLFVGDVGVGLAFAANLFGVAGQHGRDSHELAERVRRLTFKSTRALGIGWMLFGAVLVVSGTVHLIKALS